MRTSSAKTASRASTKPAAKSASAVDATATVAARPVRAQLRRVRLPRVQLRSVPRHRAPLRPGRTDPARRRQDRPHPVLPKVLRLAKAATGRAATATAEGTAESRATKPHGRMRAEVLFAAALVCASGCGPEALYADSLGVNAEGWKSAEAAEFLWEVSDTARVHDLYIDVRNDATYPFSNLYLFVDFTFPNGKTNRDTLAVELADAQGNWLGSGSGHVHDHRIVWHDDARFPLQGQYAVRIVHAMRRDPLPGISDVGLRVEYAELEEAGR